jgi:glucokinase
MTVLAAADCRVLVGDIGGTKTTLQARLKEADRNATITELGLSGKSALCLDTLELFCSILGAAAGNLVLQSAASGGLLIGGGIAPKILPALRRGAFIASFADKGRFSEQLKAVPIRVALTNEAPLLGAGHYAVDSFKGASRGASL